MFIETGSSPVQRDRPRRLRRGVPAPSGSLEIFVQFLDVGQLAGGIGLADAAGDGAVLGRACLERETRPSSQAVESYGQRGR
jgi:hypothetical protein